MGKNHGISRSIVIASESTIVCAAGRVTMATRAEHVSIAASSCSEVVFLIIDSQKDLIEVVRGGALPIVGPG
ncbi:MAG: hypothetical protein QS721_03755 [Candidatus Endonucleobacter sp. (ex Gigantidas childressi)]|nr:hypothetical protein [Candidatus Endonucleobacter sp. (ex Gigantidas childressi)]